MSSVAQVGEAAHTSDPDGPARDSGPELGGSTPGNRADASHALTVVEFGAVLDLVAGFASTGLGRERVRGLRPVALSSAIAAEHARVEAMRSLVSGDSGWQSHAIPDVAAGVARLRIEGSSWTGIELRAARTLLVSSRLTHAALTDKARDAASLAPLRALANSLPREPSLEKEIDRVVNDEGLVRDDASPALRKMRKELRGAGAELVRLLERLMARLDAQHRVDDASVTLRNGRYVIPVRREGRAALGGIVHDTSASGATLFVEPPAAIDAGNRIRELEAEEARETERILLEATDRLRPHRDVLSGALDAMVTLDALVARARYALAGECAGASLAEPGAGFTIVNGRHPLLLSRAGSEVVPFDLAMLPDERTLLVSGPNTGGKTVLLKAIALMSLMVQAGIPAPVGAGSRLAVFDRFFADIGDEQSIAASLSTFSAHLRNLTEIMREATPRSLVLVDELGSGTDPVEGAALGGAILEALTRRGTTTFATTHLGALKELAHDVPGVVNASLQFDAAALAPTYRFVKGIPGRSYGLSIARRLNMPEEVLRRAERRIPEGERDVTALLEDLERRQHLLSGRETLVDSRHDSVATREERVHARELALRATEREHERTMRRDARRYLLEARQEIEQVIRELREAGAAQIEAAAIVARRAAEQRAAGEAEALAALNAASRLEDERPATGAPEGGAVNVGDAVAVSTLDGKVGRVMEVRGSDAVVAVGAMKLTVPLAALRRAKAGRSGPAERAVALTGDQPEVVVRHEVDVRGMRVGEVDDAVQRALDDAVRADLRTLRIIHGKGTGALRERVAQLLEDDGRVHGFRLGLWNEGGAGVTIAELS
ncbi:MAG TPA: Smr/MutS family protein [Gemmatimonadaceae bacterium]|nr:Smr/MutS family protein [Gemmatimonadaceae bacterium]